MTYRPAHNPAHRFIPPATEPVNFGPVDRQEEERVLRPMDEYLNDLYRPERPTLLIVDEEDTGPKESKFPLGMWGWAAWTTAFALIAIYLILFL